MESKKRRECIDYSRSIDRDWARFSIGLEHIATRRLCLLVWMVSLALGFKSYEWLGFSFGWQSFMAGDSSGGIYVCIFTHPVPVG